MPLLYLLQEEQLSPGAQKRLRTQGAEQSTTKQQHPGAQQAPALCQAGQKQLTAPGFPAGCKGRAWRHGPGKAGQEGLVKDGCRQHRGIHQGAWAQQSSPRLQEGGDAPGPPQVPGTGSLQPAAPVGAAGTALSPALALGLSQTSHCHLPAATKPLLPQPFNKGRADPGRHKPRGTD